MISLTTPQERLDATFSALADPTRRAVLVRLMNGQATVGELAHGIEMSAPSFSRHLKVLEKAGLISRQHDAQWRRCQIQPLALRPAFDWLKDYEQMWAGQLDKLATYVDQLNSETEKRRARRERRKAPR